jgi:hypothetical protein
MKQDFLYYSSAYQIAKRSEFAVKDKKGRDLAVFNSLGEVQDWVDAKTVVALWKQAGQDYLKHQC